MIYPLEHVTMPLSSYDRWKLAGPDDGDLDMECVADFYGVEPDEVTDRHLANYLGDLDADAAERWSDW